ncbi:ribokinase [Catalinimonas alkaloidigena]|uniref:Ribokinase n=1 Tax=Catalinimonas alkaloidigena TaxID=1075417 RepID=A0A1G9SYF2_9BACT|nr:ribokinase [Catalinimonas alkaloidigena]SDM39875.1 ribokinase [Catalinimonas alkaloidigena]
MARPLAPSIVVVGSSNTDMVVKATRLPAPGETVVGGTFLMNPGGKGANQAVAAARLGGAVTFVAKVGDDVFGQQAREGFRQEGLDTSWVLTDAEHPSGVALITVDEHGENCIVVAPGANGTLTPDELQRAQSSIAQAALVLVQLEIPLETVARAVALAQAHGVRVVLNPAPARTLPDELLRHVSVITPNQTEASRLTGITVHDDTTAEWAARALHAKGIGTVILTLGAQGALVHHEGQTWRVAAPPVEAVDTTAAGDVFNGALVVGLAEGRPLRDAVDFACRAAAVSVTRMGAQASAPRRAEVDALQS